MDFPPSGLRLSANLLSRLINIRAPFLSLCDSRLFNIKSWLRMCIGWRLSTLAVFQPVVTSDSVGASVIAQHEPRTPLSRFRHTSVTSVQAEKRTGLCERGELRIKDLCEVVLNLLQRRRSTDLLVKEAWWTREAIFITITFNTYGIPPECLLSTQRAKCFTENLQILKFYVKFINKAKIKKFFCSCFSI